MEVAGAPIDSFFEDAACVGWKGGTGFLGGFEKLRCVGEHPHSALPGDVVKPFEEPVLL